MTSPGAPLTDPAQKFAMTPIFMSVINELNINQDQLEKRDRLIGSIEAALSARYRAQNRMFTYVLRFGHSRTQMHTGDVPHVEAMLSAISEAEQINVLLHSPGGDGTIVEKLVEMCRAHLRGPNQKLRIIVPNVAKSAATLFALGADEIVMGYCSELGPIDPQVITIVSGAPQWISSFAFVEARDKLMKQIAEATKRNEPTLGLMQQLAGLNIPFIDEMENQIEFARKTAVKLLDKYMLFQRLSKRAARQRKANEIARNLLSKRLFPSHGHYIDGVTARQLGLEIDLLEKEDPLWHLIWEYYMRCEVQMNIALQPSQIKTKLFEAGGKVSLVTQDTSH